ncbi:epoxide hydrolase-like protein [Ophiobolus disseminans]|uniref:Epoxide hydrolase-like protein n=1 Tax=Ophiobolus disseminans TaxID=1469910 RepID=A0A6A6ZL97_9PLEO|nr:epoxide hydrolase-like protein [Ophiobolus disseminans]
MDAFKKKTLKTSRGYTYTYYTCEGDNSLPALFFQHGWPDHAEMWEGVATALRKSNHPIIVPDLLGYDGTDKPTDPAEFKWDVMTKDLVEIIDTEKVDKVISIGHDWGSACAARLYNYHPDRVVGCVFLNVGYSPPGREPFNLDGVNKMTEQAFGYGVFHYWYLFTAPDGPALLKNNVERLYPLLHGTSDTMKRFFCVPNALRNHLTSTDPAPEVRTYAQDPAFKQAFIDRMTRDGFDAPQCWYRATVEQYQYACDKELPEGRDKVEVPVLYVGGKDDAVCRPESMYPAIQQGWLPQLEQRDLLDAAHWTPYEQPKKVAEYIGEWLGKNYGV